MGFNISFKRIPIQYVSASILLVRCQSREHRPSNQFPWDLDKIILKKMIETLDIFTIWLQIEKGKTIYQNFLIKTVWRLGVGKRLRGW